jgi:hypothetical protein
MYAICISRIARSLAKRRLLVLQSENRKKIKFFFLVDQRLNIALIQETTYFLINEVVINIVAQDVTSSANCKGGSHRGTTDQVADSKKISIRSTQKGVGARVVEAPVLFVIFTIM